MFKNIYLKMYSYIWLLLLFCFSKSFAVEQDDCSLYSTCGACISTVNCVWCADEFAKGDRRCLSSSAINTKENWCKLTINPKNVTFEETINNDLMQLRPQFMKITARPDAVVPLTIFFEAAKDYPLDVYYIMDMSHTMKSVKKDLQDHAKKIYDELTSYTNNVQLGIGSFVEKPGFPFVDLHKKPPHLSYAFKNHLSLTDNVKQFKQTMENINDFGANYDDPEAGLDALMQAMKCKDEIGWRNESRRIIILCTDAAYHSAGDGRALGVITPNDMQCHLDSHEKYSDELALTYDYPSVSQINRVASEGNFIIIFAVKEVVKDDYTKLAAHIDGAKYAALKGGKDTVQIIKNAYEESALKVKLNYDLPPYIQLTLDQSCEIPLRNCKISPEQRSVTIKGELKIKYCPPEARLKHDLEIKVQGLNEKLNIQLEAICKCDCEKSIKSQVVSSSCHHGGFLQCGICKCLPERYGVDCRCNRTSQDNGSDRKLCKMDEEDKNWCSGHGSCMCGKCECNNDFSGDFCQYNDNSCPNKCSNQGRCHLGKCNCNADWSGEDCSCTIKNDTCVAPYSKQLCSGNGDCKCGNCECWKLLGKNETYSGRFCDICDDCTDRRCKELEKYVVCNVMNEKPSCDKNYNVTSTIVQFLNKTELNGPDWYLAKWCKTQLKNDSYVIFKYQYEDGNVKLGIQNETELPPKANIFIAVGASIGTVLLIGILTLIMWKILVDMHDKKEYEKFYKESLAAGFDISLNPIYTPPQTVFTNPAYNAN